MSAPIREDLNVTQQCYGDVVAPLDSGTVHLWLLPLRFPKADLASQVAYLSQDERARAKRFRFDIDRNRWIASRYMLRSTLAAYLDGPPHVIRFAYNAYAKPFLLDRPDIEFNLSHSGSYGLLAVAMGRRVGVDIEYVRADFADPLVAHQFFSKAEQAALVDTPAESYAESFFSCWTRKESYVKAHGIGLSLALKGFDVSVKPGDDVLLLATRPDAREQHRWVMKQPEAPEQYVAALTVENK